MRFAAAALVYVLLSTCSFAQNWKQVHKKDEAKWEKATGLDSLIIHKLWREASQTADEKDDDSRIASLDLDGLAEHHHVLLVTYAGENNCLTITVFNRLTESKFEKVWSTAQPPDAAGFCDSGSGSSQADVFNGIIRIRVPHAIGGGGLGYTIYGYGWNGITYRLASEREAQGQ